MKSPIQIPHATIDSATIRSSELYRMAESIGLPIGTFYDGQVCFGIPGEQLSVVKRRPGYASGIEALVFHALDTDTGVVLTTGGVQDSHPCCGSLDAIARTLTKIGGMEGQKLVVLGHATVPDMAAFFAYAAEHPEQILRSFARLAAGEDPTILFGGNSCIPGALLYMKQALQLEQLVYVDGALGYPIIEMDGRRAGFSESPRHIYTL